MLSVSSYNISSGATNILYAQTNTRGDVIALYNGDGDVKTVYTYDSWGKLISVTDGEGNALGANKLGNLNSIRYRGYVYDSETGLYYLQSRYYDPEVGRFLNADSVDYIGYSDSVISYNMFAYCENNAVNRIDETGTFAGFAPLIAVGKTIGVSFPIVLAAIFSIILLVYVASNGEVVLGFFEALGLLVDSVIGGISSAFTSNNTKSDTTTKDKTETATKTLEDTRTKQPQHRPYQLAYVDGNGNLIKVGKKMNLVETLTCLGIKKASSSIDRRYTMPEDFKSPDGIKSKKWGVYADSQEEAKTLAVVLKSDVAPEIHGSGYYGHYHDKTHQIHIWYGQPLFY